MMKLGWILVYPDNIPNKDCPTVIGKVAGLMWKSKPEAEARLHPTDKANGGQAVPVAYENSLPIKGEE